MPKIEEFCHFYMVYRRDAEPAEVFYKENFSLRSLRLCGESITQHFNSFTRRNRFGQKAKDFVHHRRSHQGGIAARVERRRHLNNITAD